MSQRGVSLIELMIVLLIIGLISLAVSPFTSEWVAQARVAEGASALEEAIGRAKSAAMKNTAGVTGDDKPASRICISDSKINLVVPAGATGELKCDLTPIWSTTISHQVTIKTDDLDWLCSCFNNKGLLIAKDVCNTCSKNLNFRFFYPGDSEGEPHNFY
ncbi:MAG TPA: prepilin-type N-terminal cleavage/methylation domain-containing protein [Cellvibrio sp.]|nr:prepilin-type N-terminal cleavage/methylation domain-containing protein [Cellvibrio sp.]